MVGAGLSGLSFALRAAEKTRVTVVSKTTLMESNSSLVQGGIAAVLRLPDSFEKHTRDTIKVGQGLSDRENVETMVRYGPFEIEWLIENGVEFTYTQGELDLGREGGHSKRRVVHAGDITGHYVQTNLIERAKRHENIRILENMMVCDLIVEEGQCKGVTALDGDGFIHRIQADTTVLCTGGAGQVYAKTSNPIQATGDGVAIAYRAGVTMRDMEFIQFHPSILDFGSSPFFLISEAVRGEGGVLVNSEGSAFMPRYHPMHDLAPRDVVSQAIIEEQKKGPVFIDIRGSGYDYLTHRFPGIYKECLQRGFRMEKDLIPVSPAAHYLCGGVKVNKHGETSLQGLLAFGEVACTGVHGANRLASNSTLECMVFTDLAVENMDISESDFPIEHPLRCSEEMGSYSSLKHQIQSIMWEYFGIYRSKKSMLEAKQGLVTLNHQLNAIPEEIMFRTHLEDRNLATVGLLIATAASIRDESRGTHKLEEHPYRDDSNWLKHIEIKGKKVILVDH